MTLIRSSGRTHDALRAVQIIRKYTPYAEGSVWIAFGQTHVLCTASVGLGQVPRFRRGSGLGWLTAEYGMLPRATQERNQRESKMGQQTGRTQEIQRLIGRSLRNCLDFKKLGEHTITLDCDVLQADGGTRTAAITGACLALHDAVQYLIQQGIIHSDPFLQLISAVSVGVYQNQVLLDLDYAEDSHADTDMNVVLSENQDFIEVQGTAEKKPFSSQQLNQMLDLAQEGGRLLLSHQKAALGR